MTTLRLVAIDDPIASPLATRVPANAKASTKALVVEEDGRWSELLAVQSLEWDTRLLGVKTGRIIDLVSRDESRAPGYSGIADHLRALDLEYVTVRRPISEWNRLRALEAAGFRLVDGILSFTRKIENSTPVSKGTRLAKASDTEAIAELAIATFKRSRFHNDSAISNDAADRLHGEWARNSCKGTAAKAVLVVDDDRKVGGFITCKFGSDLSIGVIDLVGVAPSSAGKGIGRSLVEASCVWFASHGCKEVHVQTQIDNFAAIRLYTGAGFAPSATFATLRWSAEETR